MGPPARAITAAVTGSSKSGMWASRLRSKKERRLVLVCPRGYSTLSSQTLSSTCDSPSAAFNGRDAESTHRSSGAFVTSVRENSRSARQVARDTRVFKKKRSNRLRTIPGLDATSATVRTIPSSSSRR